MGLFDIGKRINVSEDIDIAQLNKEIEEKNLVVEQLKNDIELSKQKNEQLEEDYLAKIKELEDKQAFFNDQIAQQKDSYNARLKKLEEKRDGFQADYNDKVTELNIKAEALKAAQTELFAKKDELKRKDFLSKKKIINEKINSISESLKKYKDSFNNNIEESTKKYNELIAKKDDELVSLNEKKKKFVESANAEIEKLEKQKKEIEDYNNAQLKALADEQANIANIAKTKHAKDIKDKQHDLDEVKAEIRSLENFKRNLNNDLETTKVAHEREYKNLVAKFDAEKEKQLKEREYLKQELSDRQKRYDEEMVLHNSDYDKQVAQLDELMSLLDKKGVDTEAKLKEKLATFDSDITNKYKIFLEKTEEDYNRQAKLRQDELDTLTYQLSKEEEKFNSEKQFLENQLNNTNASFKNSIEEKTMQVNNAQVVLNELEMEHNALVRNSVGRIAELKRGNETNLKNKANEYEKALEELKKEYGAKKLEINEKIIALKNDLKNINDEIADTQKEFDEFKNEKETAKSELLAAQDAFLAKNKREKDIIEQKIADVKALAEQANRDYTNAIDSINNKRSLAQSNADSTIAEITNKYKNKTQALKDEYDANVARVSKEHEDKLVTLKRDFARNADELKQAIAKKQNDLSAYSVDVNNKIDTLRQDAQIKVDTLKQQENDLSVRISAVKQKMVDETRTFDNDVRSLQDDYVSRLNELAANQNEAIQKVLANNETEPNLQLTAIKEEYDEAQRRYSESLASINSNKKKLLESEIELKNQVDSQKAELTTELSNRTVEFEQITNEYNSTQAIQQKEIAKLQSELDGIKNKYEIEINTLNDSSEKKFDTYQKELNLKYESLVRTLDDKQERTQKQLDTELKAIETDTDNKVAALNASIAEIDAKKADYEKLYASMIESALKEVNDTKAILQELNDKRLDENQKHIATLETIKNANAEAITAKKDEYDKLLKQAGDEYTLKHKQIEDSIKDTRANTTAVIESIDKINKEYSQYLDEANARKQAIIDEHSDYISNTSKAISTAVNRINDIKNLLAESERSYKAEMNKIGARRIALQEEYSRNIKEIEAQYKNQTSQIESEYNDKVEKANDAHSETLRALKADHNARLKELEKSVDDKKDELHQLKKTYKKDIAVMEADTKSSITSLKNQENELRATVDSVKAIMDSEKRKYDDDLEQINKDKEVRITQIDRLYKEDLDRIILENETTPNAQLAEVKDKFDIAQNEYNKRMLQISDNKRLVDEKEAEIVSRNYDQKQKADRELANKNDEYTNLKAESESKFAALDLEINDKRNELSAFTGELNTMVKRYRETKEQDFIATSKQLDDQLNSLLDKNSISEQTTSSGYNNNVSNMSIETNAKIAALDRKIGEINAIKNKKKEECDKLLFERTNDFNVVISDLKEELNLLTTEKAQKAEFYKESLEKTRNDNHEVVNKKREEAAAAIENAKQTYALESQNIKAHAETLRNQIEKNNKNLEVATHEYEEYAAASQARNEAVLNEQADYLSYIDKQKAKVEEKIDGLKGIIANKQSRFDEQLAVIEAQRAEAQSEYDGKVVSIDREYQEKLRAINEKNVNDINGAREKHESVIRALQASYEERCERIKNDYESKREEYKNIKNNYKNDIEKYKQDFKNKVSDLKKQQNEFANKVDEMKAQIKEDNNNFNEESKRIQNDFNEEVKKINEDKRIKVKELNHTYIEIPNDELNMINSTLNDAKLEYESSVANFETRKKELDDYEKSVIDKFEKLRNEANESLSKKNAQYEETYEKLQNVEFTFDEKLNKSKKDLENLRMSIDANLEKIKADKQKELDNYSTRYYEDYEKQQARYKEIQDSTILKNDKEVAALTDHLNTKKASIDTLINEINARKQKIEDEKQIDYNEEVAITNKLQSELDAIVNERNLKKTTYENEIASKKETNRLSIESMKARLEEYLVKKKEELVAEGDATQAQVKKVQEEISSLRIEKDSVNKKLEAYEKEKSTSVESINKELEVFLKTIDGKLNILAQKSIALDEAHKKRIIDVKTQIAQTISEYDDLMKLKPQLVSDAYGQEIDFMSVTKKFKDMVDELESSHNKIMLGLEEKRVTTIDSIKQEIDSLETAKPEKLKEFEDQVTKLTETYDAMLADEKAKQTTLNNELLAAKLDKEKLENVSLANLAQMDRDFTALKDDINNSFNMRLANSNEQFGRLATSLRKEFNDLVSERDTLKTDLAKLNEGFMKVDDDIRIEMMKLKNSYNTQLLTIQATYEARVKTNRDRLKSLDTMSNDVDVLFID